MVPEHIAATVQQVQRYADAERLFGATMEGASSELVQVAFLDEHRGLIELTSSTGDPSSVELPIAAILRRAVLVGARGMVLAHNHPSGDPTPSAADIEATRRLAEIARDLELRIYDHLVFAGGRCLSFQALGLL